MPVEQPSFQVPMRIKNGDQDLGPDKGVDEENLGELQDTSEEEGNEQEEIDDSVERVFAWIQQGIDVQNQILDLTGRSFSRGLSGEEAADIIKRFESIPTDIAKILAEFDDEIMALMRQEREEDSRLTSVLRRAARLRGELEERVGGIEQGTEKDDFEKMMKLLMGAMEKSGKGFIDWSEGLLEEIKEQCDELDKLQLERRVEDSDRMVELQQEIDDRKRGVAWTFRNFIADSRLYFLRFRTNNYILLNLRLASSMTSEEKALELLKFRRQDEELVRFSGKFLEEMSKYEHELSERLDGLG